MLIELNIMMIISSCNFIISYESVFLMQKFVPSVREAFNTTHLLSKIHGYKLIHL
jgi:hypothetical protein